MHSQFDIAADLDTPVSAYLKLAPFQPRFLLESVAGGERLGRYSFIGFGRAFELRLEGGRLKLDGQELRAPQGRTELLDQLRQALQRAPRPGPELSGVPFQGGLVGATGIATAAHLDYRVQDRSGRYLNPRQMISWPSDKPLDRRYWTDFLAVRDSYLRRLESGLEMGCEQNSLRLAE